MTSALTILPRLAYVFNIEAGKWEFRALNRGCFGFFVIFSNLCGVYSNQVHSEIDKSHRNNRG